MNTYEVFFENLSYNEDTGLLSYPFIYDKSMTFYQYIDKVFNEYKAEIEKLKSEDVDILNLCIDGHKFDLKRDVDDVCQTILKCIELSYHGLPGEAYLLLSNYFRKNNNHALNLLPKVNHPNIMIYRARTEFGLSQVKDLFHVPFSLRHKVSTERFSIPGYPALYLSGSVYSCWKELGCPDLSKLSISQFHIMDVECIDLTYPLIFLWPEKDKLWSYYSFFMFFPLIIASSINVLQDGVFKPEYIIPQLFTQVMKTVYGNHIFGIKFMSTKIPKNGGIGNEYYHNIIIPTIETDKESGYCNILASHVAMTTPVSFTENELAEQKDKKLDSSLCFQNIEFRMKNIEMIDLKPDVL